MKSDLVILYPFTYETEAAFSSMGSCGESDVFIQQMDEILKYEVAESVSHGVIRRNLGEYQFQFYENYPEMHYRKLPVIRGTIYLAVEVKTKICICEIVFHFAQDLPLTYYLDSVMKGDIHLLLHQETAFQAYMEALGLTSVGLPKSCVFLSEMPSERELTYLIASEFYDPDDVAFIQSDELHGIIQNNMSQYDFLKCYSSPNSVVHIMRTFHEDFQERFYFEGLSIFVAELILFHITALNRTNAKVVRELTMDAEPSLEKIKTINLEYARTVTFWNVGIFRSTTAQIAARKFYQAFEVDQLIETYNRNQSMMEHIMSVKTAIQEETQNRILNVAAFLLTVIQCCQFLYSVVMAALEHTLSVSNVLVGSATATLALLFLLMVILRKKRSRKRSRTGF